MKRSAIQNRETVRLAIAGAVFLLSLFLALLPKSPVPPFDLPQIVLKVAGEVNGKYWWALAVGGLFSVWFNRRLLGRLIVTLIIAQILVEAFKLVVGEVRPDGRFFNSFPSGHTTVSFAFATLMSAHFRWGWLWLLFATVVGISRVLTRAHWWHDVVGGAALGYIIAIAICRWAFCGEANLEPSTSPERPRHPSISGKSNLQGNQTFGRGERKREVPK